jgi:hypothetical protein
LPAAGLGKGDAVRRREGGHEGARSGEEAEGGVAVQDGGFVVEDGV